MLDELVAANEARKNTISAEVAETREQLNQTLHLLHQSQVQVSDLEKTNEKLASDLKESKTGKATLDKVKAEAMEAKKALEAKSKSYNLS